MEYRYWLALIPAFALGIILGGYCFAFLNLFRERARLRKEEANLRKRLADLGAV